MKTDLMFDGRRVYLTNSGYPSITMPYSEGGRRLLVHRVVAERALGEPLGDRHVHHKDGDKMNWAIENLEILSSKMHGLLHARNAIIQAGGNPETDSLCSSCHRALPKGNFRTDRQRWNGLTASCNECHRKRMEVWRREHPEETREAGMKSYRKVMADPERKANRNRQYREWYAKPENKAKVAAAYLRKKAQAKG